LRRGALEASFRLLELARIADYNPSDLLQYSIQPLFESNLFNWLASALTTKLGEANLLEKDIFFYLSSDLICTAVKTYVVVAQKIIKSGATVKVKLSKVYLDLAK
jgi:hypothetical protein